MSPQIMGDQSTTVDIICQTHPSCFTVVTIHNQVNQVFSFYSWVFNSVNGWHHYHSNIHTYDAKLSEFFSWYKSNTWCYSSHCRSAGEVVDDITIWNISGCYWLSVFLWIVFSFGIDNYSCFKSWSCVFKQKVFVKNFIVPSCEYRDNKLDKCCFWRMFSKICLVFKQIIALPEISRLKNWNNTVHCKNVGKINFT